MKKKITTSSARRNAAAIALILAGGALLVSAGLAGHYAHLNEAGIALLAIGLVIELLG